MSSFSLGSKSISRTEYSQSYNNLEFHLVISNHRCEDNSDLLPSESGKISPPLNLSKPDLRKRFKPLLRRRSRTSRSKRQDTSVWWWTCRVWETCTQTHRSTRITGRATVVGTWQLKGWRSSSTLTAVTSSARR